VDTLELGGPGYKTSFQKNVRPAEAGRKTYSGAAKLGKLQIQEKIDGK
jgi:hypothetical protein